MTTTVENSQWCVQLKSQKWSKRRKTTLFSTERVIWLTNTHHTKKENNKNLDAHYIAKHKCHSPGPLFVSIRRRLENSMPNITTIRNHSNSREQMDKNGRNNNNEKKEEFEREMLNARFLVLSLSCTSHELLELCCKFFTNINWCE